MPLKDFGGMLAETLAQAAERRRGDRDATPSATRLPGRALLGIAVIAVLVLGGWWLISAQAATASCDQALSDAADSAPTDQSWNGLNPAFTRCTGADDFYAAAAAHPAAMHGAPSLVEWLDNRCATTPALATSPVCRSR